MDLSIPVMSNYVLNNLTQNHFEIIVSKVLISETSNPPIMLNSHPSASLVLHLQF